MQQRRDFLRSGGSLLAGSLLFSKGRYLRDFAISHPPFGIQLFTVMASMDDNSLETLKQIAAIGYKEIESAFSRKGGFYGMSEKDFSKMVKDTGMHWRSHHVVGGKSNKPTGAKPPTGADGKPLVFAPMKNLSENYQQLVDEAAEGGVDYLICASIPVNTFDEIKRAVDVFNKTSEACKKAGIQFAYHNHITEFDLVEGHRPFDYILSNTDKHLVKMELDLGWASKAGQDPVVLFKEHPGRFPLWHIKDFTPDFKKITRVGEGSIDFKRIFEHARESGMKYFFIEEDGAPDPITDIAACYNNLKKIIG